MRWARWVPVALLATVAAAQERVGDEQFEALFRHVVLPIEGANACHRFRIYLAENREQQARGLMFVREMAADDGMLFVYRRPGRVSMWMRNTVIPLDMIFADADGRILNIEANTEPYSRRSIAAEGDAGYVLELNAGTAADLGLVSGRRLFRPELSTF